MASDAQPDPPGRTGDRDDEIVALSKALKDQVRDLKARVRAQGLKGETPSFAPGPEPRGDQEP